MPQEIISIPNRKKYDSNIVWLFSTGNEKHLPEEFRKSIPYSTISTWRNMDYAAYHGHEFRYIQEKGMEWFELYSEHKKAGKSDTNHRKGLGERERHSKSDTG